VGLESPPMPDARDFPQLLDQAWRRSGSLLCVGLDPDPQRLPPSLAGAPDAILRFCTAIVDATAAHACAFKPQIAYFAAQRAEDQLERLISHIRTHHPQVPVVLDAKRGDIGATAKQYAAEAFERYDADAVTVNPYMGFDSIEPYLEHPGRGVFLLCRTSNAGGSDLQALRVTDGSGGSGGELLYERVARLSAGAWNQTRQLGLVVGATFPGELARVRELAPDLPLLVPGVGAQGGDVAATVKAGCDAAGTGILINSSRAILYASPGRDFAEAAERAARQTCDDINRHRT
jgi:orotidine-5'-phosphate decarboxylase